METKYTTGPWFVAKDTDLQESDGNIVESPNGYEIRPEPGIKLGDEESDLRLIASAPDLLEALVKISKMDYGNPYAKKCADIAREAIAKATGAA